MVCCSFGLLGIRAFDGWLFFCIIKEDSCIPLSTNIHFSQDK